jgi:hypothetical protein
LDGNIVVNHAVPAPSLGIATSAGNSVLLWPASSSNYVLQQNPGLNPSNWTDVPTLPTWVNQVTVSAAGGNQNFRLISK